MAKSPFKSEFALAFIKYWTVVIMLFPDEQIRLSHLRILVKDDPEVGVLSILVNDMSRR